MKAITTRYYGPTNTRGSRIVAKAEGGKTPHRVSLSYDHALNIDGNHRAAAAALARKMNWTPVVFAYGTNHECDGVHVMIFELRDQEFPSETEATISDTLYRVDAI